MRFYKQRDSLSAELHNEYNLAALKWLLWINRHTVLCAVMLNHPSYVVGSHTSVMQLPAQMHNPCFHGCSCRLMTKLSMTRCQAALSESLPCSAMTPPQLALYSDSESLDRPAATANPATPATFNIRQVSFKTTACTTCVGAWNVPHITYMMVIRPSCLHLAECKGTFPAVSK